MSWPEAGRISRVRLVFGLLSLRSGFCSANGSAGDGAVLVRLRLRFPEDPSVSIS